METHTTIQPEQKRIDAGVVEWFFHQPLLRVLSIQPIGACIMAGYFWNRLSHTLLLSWLAYMLTLSLLFTATTLFFRRQYRKATKPLGLKLPPPLGGITVGLGWGITSFWPGVMSDPSAMIFTTIVAMGVVASSIGFIAPHIRAFYLLVVFTILPFIYNHLTSKGESHITLGVMLMLFLILVLISGHNMKRAVVNAIKLRFENINLVEELTVKNLQAEQARELAEHANQSKSKFLAAASHDLRQPLHALGLFVDVLDSRIRFPEVRTIVDNIKVSIEALASLFNALLDISKLDAGVLEPKLTDVAIQPLFQRLLADFQAKAQDKGIDLRIHNCRYIVHTDPAMLERILLNLVSNAIRYTNQGCVLLGCRHRGKHLRIEIYDTGLGIPANQIEKIFEEFYQIENPERDRRKGLGLGLAIVKRLCLLLSYPIELSSIYGKGTCFRVTLPRVVTHTFITQHDNAYTTDIATARVLLIDDEIMIRHGMRDLLQQWGCQVIDAESIQHAITLMSIHEFLPNIILTDYRLREDQTGIEAVSLIRKSLNQTIPAILITGDTAPDRLREAKASGLQLLHKPVSPAKLRALLSYMLQLNQVN
jgi:signal transduction histidine kinase